VYLSNAEVTVYISPEVMYSWGDILVGARGLILRFFLSLGASLPEKALASSLARVFTPPPQGGDMTYGSGMAL
jgi:hypothetical protein